MLSAAGDAAPVAALRNGGSPRYGYASIVLTLRWRAVNPYAVGQLREPVVLVTIVATGVICYFLASLAWYAAINRRSLAWTDALVIPGIPLLSILCAIVFLGERATCVTL